MTPTRFALRRSALFASFFLFALVELTPLRWAIDILELDRGLAAREASGSIWLGGLKEAQLGPAPLGDVQVRLNRLPLLIGRTRLSIERESAEAPLEGAISFPDAGLGLNDFTGQLRLAGTLAPLPVGVVELDDVSVIYQDGLCQAAEGKVRAQLAAQIPGLALASGLIGSARCAGGRLLLPLASQSGMERLDLSFDSNGGYRAIFRVTPVDPSLHAGLIAAGFRPLGNSLALRLDGRL